MIIEHLSLTNFRNYARLEISVPKQPILLHGDNAQGKTSLLEALYYIATSKSPYTTSDRQLIHWQTEHDPLPYARIVAEVSDDTSYAINRIEITLLLENGRYRKVIKVNGNEKKVREVVGMVNVVLFVPQDLSLVDGAPSDRRRFMDTTLSQVDADYNAALDTYDKILPQRNALLRRIAEKYGSPTELDYWDAQLVEAGSIIISGRQKFLRELEISAQRAHGELTGGKETLTLQYQPSFAPSAEENGQLSFGVLGLDLHRELTPEQIKPQFEEQLKKEQKESIQRGVTLSGPHRDELRLLINTRDAGLYGSRGQARTAVMALKLAERDWMTARTGKQPILLLDEVIAELDAKRRAYLLSRINDDSQTLLTTTEMEIFTPDFLKRSAVWEVIDGKISV